MAYGVNAPWGLKPTQRTSGNVWDLVHSYPIPSGFPLTLKKYDLVALYGGYIAPYVPIGTSGIIDTTLVRSVSLGVFMGVNFTSPTANNPIAPYQTNPMWAGGTVTANGQPATAYIIDDPDAEYNIQANNVAALASTIIGANANVDVTNTGNISLGESGMMLDASTILPEAVLNANTFTPLSSTNNGITLKTLYGNTGSVLPTVTNASSTVTGTAPSGGGAITGGLAAAQVATYAAGTPESSMPLPLRIRGIVPIAGNTLSVQNPYSNPANQYTSVGIPYVNLLVSLNNTAFQVGQIGV